MPLCVITDYMGDDVEVERELLARAGIDVYVARSPIAEDWIGFAEEADAILTRHAPIRNTSIKRLNRCRIISRYGTGHDNIDIDAASEHGIEVAWVEDYCTDEVADHALALLLSCARCVVELADHVRDGGWTPEPHPPIVRLRGRTLGLLGCGRIGSAVASRAVAFGLNVIAYDPYSPMPANVHAAKSIDELVSRADILSLHTPLTAETRGVIDEHRISLLPEGAIIINVARGGLIDFDAAERALRSGRLAALGLDVLDHEPPAPNHPLRTLPRALVTPHLAYYSRASVEEAKRRSVTAILRALANTPEAPAVRATAAADAAVEVMPK
ncbi:MAG TPA: C-terminal binding protein [Gaiellaceae bacterium]|nr:C-terminal binding protein [Gaiellaceae bacterium]